MHINRRFIISWFDCVCVHLSRISNNPPQLIHLFMLVIERRVLALYKFPPDKITKTRTGREFYKNSLIKARIFGPKIFLVFGGKDINIYSRRSIRYPLAERWIDTSDTFDFVTHASELDLTFYSGNSISGRNPIRNCGYISPVSF